MDPPRPAWTPSSEDFARVFAEQNPWHASGEVPESLARTVERPLGRLLPGRLLEDRPRRFQVILGPRRVGKTTCMYQAVRALLRAGVPRRDLWWLRLDHPLLATVPLGELVRRILDGFRAERGAGPLHLFLDELTWAADWDLWLKTFHDEGWPVRVLATSSSVAALRSRRVESGIGRWEESFLAPCLLPELLDLERYPVDLEVRPTLAGTLEAAARGNPPLPGVEVHRRRLLLCGGFPELLLDLPREAGEEALLLRSQAVLRDDAIERAVYRDIPRAFGVDSPVLLERLLYVLAGQVAGLLSPRSLCSDLDGLSQPTLDRYLSHLEQCFLVFTLRNFSGSERAIQKRGRKVYFVDGAVRNAALQRGLAPLEDPSEMGHLVENMAAAHLHALARASQARLFHWRQGEEEVDLLLHQPGAPVAFEVSSRPHHSRAGLRAL
ncbi:MAG: ATP-binding protein, partial [Planctomycetaceae bacterium]|nr:ATP-binding protein [Planctomycetaceae bacterium]